MRQADYKFPLTLLVLYIVVFLALAINPYQRSVWFAENLPIVAIVAILVITFKKIQFSHTSYIFMSVLIFLHTIGGHYTFERVPFDWVTNFFGFERNHYDRIAHFSVGFYALPICEYLERKKLVNVKTVTFLFAMFAIWTVAACYEVIEWLYAALSDPLAGTAFLGSQGDIWDAQKDMLADGSGALFATVYFHLWWKRKNEVIATDK